MDPKELEDFTNQLYDLGLSDSEVADKIAELESSQPAAANGSQSSAPAPKPGIISKESALPSTVEAVKNFPSFGDIQAGMDEQAAYKKAHPEDPGLKNFTPANFKQSAGGLAAAPFEVMKGLGQDIAGGAFRLAGALVPGLRGKTQDAAGKDRQRTMAEALQNPNGSLTTPLDEGLDKSSLPDAVKTAGHVALGVAQGVGVGAAQGFAKGAARAATAGAREGVGGMMVRTADAVQNLRLGATPKDVLDGYTPRTLAKSGLNAMAPAEAYQATEKELATLTTRARAIKSASDQTIDVGKVIADTRRELLSKKFNFNEAQVKDAIDEIQATVKNQIEKDGGAVGERAPFVPRRPISQLTPDEIRAGLDSKEIRFSNQKGRLVPEYAKPEAAPANFLPDPNEISAPLNLIDANLLKTEVGKESAFQHLAGRVRGDKASNAAEQVYNRFYANLKRAVDPVGGAELQAINKRFSELIPVQNVLTRAMTREELGAALGRADLPTTKFGIIRATMRATKTDRAVMLNNAGERLQAAGAADLERGSGAILQDAAAAGAKRGALRGALVNGIR